MNGVEEESVQFTGAPTEGFAGTGRYRTLGPGGPMYQVLEIRGDRILAWLSNSDEEIEMPLSSALADPLAH